MLNNSSPGRPSTSVSRQWDDADRGAILWARRLGIEIDPLFVDLAIRRWQAFTDEKAKRATDGVTFETHAPVAPTVEEAS